MVSEATYGTEIRKVNLSRGNRMGNNAFLEDKPVEEATIRQYLSNKYFQDRLVHMPRAVLTTDIVKLLMDLDHSMK
jgi:hypothetical protein